MMNVAICDDEQTLIDRIKEQLEQYTAETGAEFRITVFYDGSELLQNYDTKLDLIFLDIKMKHVSGLEAAKKIRMIDGNVTIVFLTSLIQYALDGYKVNAMDYVIKPIKYIRLKVLLDNWLLRCRQNDNPYLIVSNDTGHYKIFLKSLRYLETFNRNLLLHTEYENIISYKKMRQMEAELSGYWFVRCHSGYIVNLYHVKRVEKLEIELLSGEILPISQPKRKIFMQQVADFWGDRL